MASKKSKPKSKRDSSLVSARKQRDLSDAQKETLKTHAFPPGKSGNLSGRPRGIGVTALLKLLERPIPNDTEGRTNLDVIVAQLAAKGGKGDLKAIDMIFDRIDGKPLQQVEQTGRGGGPIEYVDMTRDEKIERLKALKAKGNGKPATS